MSQDERNSQKGHTNTKGIQSHESDKMKKMQKDEKGHYNTLIYDVITLKTM